MQASQQLNSNQEQQQQVVKAKFLWSVSSSTKNREYQVSTEVGAEEETFLAEFRGGGGGGDHVSGNLCARTGTATTEENHFGSSCCFMAEY